MTASFLSDLPSGAHAASLPGLTLVNATGDDAVTFLHGQITQDLQGLAADQARPAAYCTAKGRILGSLLIWRDREPQPVIQALLPQDTAAGVLKRLRMFVLRAKVTLAEQPASVVGVWADTSAAVQALAERTPGLPTEPWHRVTGADGTTWIAAPCATPGVAARWWVVGTALVASEAQAPAAAWEAQDIAAGLAWITQPTQELFTPQMVNLDLIGGVSFTKGCYPGQEIVARSHYLGKQKRRMLRGVVPGNVAAVPGQDVYDAGRGDEPVGRVAASAAFGGEVSLLFEAPFAEAADAQLRLGAIDGPDIALAALPYDITATR